MIVFCFGIFFDVLKLNTKEKNEKKRAIVDAAVSQFGAEGVDSEKIIIETAKKIQEKWHSKLVEWFMNPKVQICLIFVFLFLSLGALLYSYFVKVTDVTSEDYQFWLLFIHLSSWTYLISVLLIMFFVRSIIMMKEKLESNKPS